MKNDVRLLISDADGPLFPSKSIHYKAFNDALATIDEKFIISENDHATIFDGISTKNKLKILAETRGFPVDRSEEISELKQKITVELYEKELVFDPVIYETVKKLKEEGYLFCVASNAVKETLHLALRKIGIFDLCDKIYSNESVENQKPHSQIYLKCMTEMGANPGETVIFEDSRHGRDAAVKSGAFVCGFDSPDDFNYSNITSFINKIKPKKIKWAAKSDTTILIPLAGMGSRFATAGYKLPKPLIPVNGRPMIQAVVENLNIDANYIFICQKEHYEQYNLGILFDLMVPGCTVIQQEGKLAGAAHTALLAKELINNKNHLLIANSDQLVEWDSCDFMYNLLSTSCDGGILTFKSDGNSKWSYAKTDKNDIVSEVAEKVVISDNATVGIYFFNRGFEYVKYTEQMINKNIRTNNEFYICPVFNEFIQDGKKIKAKNCDKMMGLGTPEDLEAYLKEVK